MRDNHAVQEWIRYAESAYVLANKGKVSTKVLYNDLCFEAQQSAEKAIKALLIFYNIKFPKTHDIEYLLNLLKQAKVDIPEVVRDAKILTDYANLSRYPDSFDTIDKKEYKQAIKLTEKVLKWAKSIIEKKENKLF